jgi:hypothetical protein
MPTNSHPCVEAPADDTVICRFMDFPKFRDLFANEELYLRRVDLFKEEDPWEALPSDEHIRAKLGLRRYDPADELRLIEEQAFAGRIAKGISSRAGRFSRQRRSICGSAMARGFASSPASI